MASQAGSDGIGQLPPLGDRGFSLNATYDHGIAGANINCTCNASSVAPPPVNVTNQTCDYALGSNLRCVQGVVSTCSSAYLRCFLTVPPASLARQPAVNNSFYCFANGTIVEAPSVNATLPPGASQCNTTAVPLALILPLGAGPRFTLGAYTCLGSFPPASNFTVLSVINGTLYDTICNAGPCPPASSNLTRANALTRCGGCNETLVGVVESVILNTRICGPYGCRRIATATCNYTYAHTWNDTQDIGNLPFTTHPTNTWNAFFWGHASSYSTDQLPPFFDTVTLTVTYDPANPPAVLCPNPFLAVQLFRLDNADPTAPEVIALDPTPGTADMVNALLALQQATDQGTINTIARAFNDACLSNTGDFVNLVLNGVSFCNWVQYVNFTLVSQTSTVIVPFPFNETATACPLAPIGCVADFNSTCSCAPDVLAVCGISYVVGSAAAGLEIDNIHEHITYVNLADNRVSQLPYGMKLNRTSEALILNMTTTIIGNGFSSENSLLRRLYLWDGEFVSGVVHDYYYGVLSAATDVTLRAFSFHCDNGCPQPFVLATDFRCTVDASTPIPKLNTTYKTIQAAIDDGCEDINIRAHENFYPENLVINNRVRRISTLDNACILGKQHEIRVTNLVLEGLCLLHPGDLSQPLFRLFNNMDRLDMLALLMDGNGVRGGGIFQVDETQPRINTFTLNQTQIRFWNYVTLFLSNVDNVIIAHNLFNRTTGRTVDTIYRNGFRFHDNALLSMRGISGVSGIKMVRFRANNEDTGCLQPGPFGPCVFYNNIQLVDNTEDDFPDTGFSIVGGHIPASNIFGNQITKAAIGFELRRVRSIPEQSIRKVVRLNPLIRPSNIQSITTSFGNSQVFDWSYDVYFIAPGINYPIVRTSVQCNYPCGPVEFNTPGLTYCTVNPNYQLGLVADYGIRRFSNATQAQFFCYTTRISSDTGLQEVPIFFTGEDAGRNYYEQITMNRTGVTFIGALLDSGELFVPPVCFPRSNIWGTGHLDLQDNFTSVNMSYTMNGATMLTVYNMWSSTNDLQYPIFNVNFTNNTIDGNNELAYSFTRALMFVLGWDTSNTENAQFRRGGAPIPENKLLRNSTGIFRYNNFVRFSSFRDNLIAPDGSMYNASSDEFPFIDPLYLQFINENNPFGIAHIEYNNFSNVDRRVADVRFALNVTFIGNLMVDVGGRAPDNPAVILITSNRNQAFSSQIWFEANNLTQTKPLLFTETNSNIAPGLLTAIVIRGFGANGLICVANNNMTGLPNIYRFSGMTYFQGNNTNFPSPSWGLDYPTILSCIDNVTNPLQFDDKLDPLRRICAQNRLTNGTVHGFIYGDSYQDISAEDIVACDAVNNTCCVPPDPTFCTVTQPFRPTHPWAFRFYFPDLQSAIDGCPFNEIVLVDGNFTLHFDPQLLPNSTFFNTSLFDVITIRANASNTVIFGCNHTMDAGRFRFVGFNFSHVCLDPTLPTWNYNSDHPNATIRLLELVNNWFDGNNATANVVSGVADDRFLLEGNTFNNYLGDRIVDVQGRFCNDSYFVNQNTWNGCKGSCARITQFGGAEFNENLMNDAGGNSATENAVVFIGLCNQTGPVPYSLTVRRNKHNQDVNATTQTIVGGGYTTVYWIDPVQDQYLASVDISSNQGKGIGTCLRQDHRPNESPPLLDPQEKVRKLAISDNNLQCLGTHFDVRLNNEFSSGAPGGNISWDLVVESDKTFYRGFFCNGMCDSQY